MYIYIYIYEPPASPQPCAGVAARALEYDFTYKSILLYNEVLQLNVTIKYYHQIYLQVNLLTSKFTYK